MSFILNLLTYKWGSRKHLVEIHDLDGCPSIIREGLQEALALSWKIEVPFFVKKSAARQAAPIFIDALRRSGTDEILDVCSGGGGPFETFAGIDELKGVVKLFTLTDLYPNVAAFKRLADMYPGRVTYSEKPVDATACNYGGGKKRYLRTMCASMHHMPEGLLEKILADVVAKNDAFAALEMTSRSIISTYIMPLGSPVLALISYLDRLRHFRSWRYALSRFLLTFVVPVIPLVFVMDGLVSCVRTYTEEEFLAVARRADPDGKYEWTVKEQILDGLFIPLVSYVGIPKNALEK